jgi:N-acetylglutamate synthase
VSHLTLYAPRATTRADETAVATLEAWGHLMDAHPDAWSEGEEHTRAFGTGIPSAAVNGVWSTRRDPDPDEVARLLDVLAGAGLPHALQVRPAAAATVAPVAEARGMAREEDAPLMRLDDPSRLAGARAEDLTIRALEPDEASLHARIAATCFGEPEDHFVRLFVPELLQTGATTAYVGERGGEPVATAIAVRPGRHVGVFNVATLEPHRRRGYGAAITVRAIEDALAAGATWAWLQSTEAGYRIYEALGFATVERWATWMRA